MACVLLCEFRINPSYLPIVFIDLMLHAGKLSLGSLQRCRSVSNFGKERLRRFARLLCFLDLLRHERKLFQQGGFIGLLTLDLVNPNRDDT